MLGLASLYTLLRTKLIFFGHFIIYFWNTSATSVCQLSSWLPWILLDHLQILSALCSLPFAAFLYILNSQIPRNPAGDFFLQKTTKLFLNPCFLPLIYY